MHIATARATQTPIKHCLDRHPLHPQPPPIQCWPGCFWARADQHLRSSAVPAQEPMRRHIHLPAYVCRRSAFRLTLQGVAWSPLVGFAVCAFWFGVSSPPVTRICEVVAQTPHLFNAASFPEALGDHLSVHPYLVLLGHLVNSSSVLA